MKSKVSLGRAVERFKEARERVKQEAAKLAKEKLSALERGSAESKEQGES